MLLFHFLARESVMTLYLLALQLIYNIKQQQIAMSIPDTYLFD